MRFTEYLRSFLLGAFTGLFAAFAVACQIVSSKNIALESGIGMWIFGGGPDAFRQTRLFDQMLLLWISGYMLQNSLSYAIGVGTVFSVIVFLSNNLNGSLARAWKLLARCALTALLSIYICTILKMPLIGLSTETFLNSAFDFWALVRYGLYGALANFSCKCSRAANKAGYLWLARIIYVLSSIILTVAFWSTDMNDVFQQMTSINQ